ncbi:helix-turn-helix domain-containing protein [Streptomyces uncialis]|uniref:helix-turn-helix domain-containing protein n=1 Tax=Streptomyces uncialis TaxID=1048205 RepID=UPI00364B8084
MEAVRNVVGTNIKRLREQRNWSQAHLARRICIAADVSGDPIGRQEVSRYENGRRTPREWLPFVAQALNVSVHTLTEPCSAPGPAAEDSEDITEHARASVAHLLDHDNRFGGDHVATAAVQVWRSGQRTLDTSSKQHLAAVAELAEVAGWILFDADRQDEARHALLEAHMYARLAGDGPLQWFVLDLVAMHSLHTGRAAEALSISDELLTRPRVPRRVALMAQIRRATALAHAGDRSRALAAIETATGGLQDSVHERDPAWTWWIDEGEVARHHGEILMSLGATRAALPELHHATLVEPGEGRRKLGHAVAELTALVTLGAWREAETAITELVLPLGHVSSSRIRHRLGTTLRHMERYAPPWLTTLARDITPTVPRARREPQER